MVTIVDGSGTLRGIILQSSFFSSGIPCALCKPGEYIQPGNTVISFDRGSFGNDNELVIRADGKAFGNSVRRNAEISRMVECVEDLLYSKFGINVRSFFSGRYLVKDDIMYVCGMPIHLTEIEKFILLYLAYNKDAWSDADNIARHCFFSHSTDSVRVHVLNLNRQVCLYSAAPFIEMKRGKGYRISYYNTYQVRNDNDAE